MRKNFIYYKSLLRIVWIYLIDKIIFRKPAAVLMYHSVDSNNEFFTVTPNNFEWQMGYLRKNGFNVVSLAELVEHIKSNKKIPVKTVVLTFDDGYEDNFLDVFPILKKYNLPATIFLMTGFIGRKDYTKREIKLPMLDWTQIKEMHDSGLVYFEPHTVGHPKLSRLGHAEIEKELSGSKKEIEEKLNKKCQFFAYPKGDYNEVVLGTTKKFFRAALTINRGFTNREDEPYLLKRNSVDSLTDKFRFKMKI